MISACQRKIESLGERMVERVIEEGRGSERGIESNKGKTRGERSLHFITHGESGLIPSRRLFMHLYLSNYEFKMRPLK